MKLKITSVDVAKAAGVSQSLVSLALNPNTANRVKPQTYERIISEAKRLGYRMNMNASSMKSNRANAIGIISAWDMNSYVYAPIIKGVKTACFERNFALTLCSSEKNENDVFDFREYYYQRRIDGLVVISYVEIEHSGMLTILDEENIPYTCVIGARNLEDVTSVDVDYVKSGELAVVHLWERGYDTVIYIMKDDYNSLNYAEAERLYGCRSIAEKKGMNFILYRGFIGNVSADDYLYSSAELIRLVKEGRFKGRCAVVSTSFECYSVLNAALEAKINVPDDLGVISLDNERYNAYLSPPLTSVKQPLDEMGKTAAELLLKRLNGEDTVRKTEFAPLLSVRKST